MRLPQKLVSGSAEKEDTMPGPAAKKLTWRENSVSPATHVQHHKASVTLTCPHYERNWKDTGSRTVGVAAGKTVNLLSEQVPKGAKAFCYTFTALNT